MKQLKQTAGDAELLRQRLDGLGNIPLPASLSAEALFARLDAGTLSLPQEAAEEKKVIPWNTLVRRVLPVAACLVLVVAVARSGGASLLRQPETGAPMAAPKEAAMDTAMEPPESSSAAMDQSSTAAAEESLDGGQPSLQMAPAANDASPAFRSSILFTGGAAEDSERFQGCPVLMHTTLSRQSPSSLDSVSKAYEAADLVLLATVQPRPSLYGGKAVPWGSAALVSASSPLKGALTGNPQTDGEVSFAGGYVPLEEYAGGAGLDWQSLKAQVAGEWGLTQDAVATAFARVSVENRPTLGEGQEAVLLLSRQQTGDGGERWVLLDSDYAVLPVAAGVITDWQGAAYGTVQSPQLQ